MSPRPRLQTREPGSGTSRRPGGPLELVDAPRKPPPAPRRLAKRSRQLWRELYAEPVAELWRPADAALVLRLILLRERLELEGSAAPGWVYAATSSLEDRLLLNPRARRAAGVVYVPPAPSSAAAGNGVRRIDERRRARLARG